MQIRTTTHWLMLAIAAVQIIDVIIHAATDQLEPVRVLSNGIVLAWLALMVWGKPAGRASQLTAAAVGGYLLLNGYFLLTRGFINPANGQPRLALLVLVAITLVLSAAWTHQRTPAQA